MYNLNANESLAKLTKYKIEGGEEGSVYFELYEVISPEISEKYIAVPTQPLQVHKPKDKYIIRASTSENAISGFVAAVRGVPLKDLFEPSR